MDETEVLALAAAAKRKRAGKQEWQPSPAAGQLQSQGPGPGGAISRDLYDMGAIGRRVNPDAAPVVKPQSDILEGFGSGLVRGASALVDLPGQAFSATGGLIAKGLEKSGVVSPQTASLARNSLRMGPMGSGSTGADAADLIFPGARSYEPQTTAGEYAQTIGEFLPASVAGPGSLPARVALGGVAPAVASETAGQLTKDTALEPFARVVGAVAAPTAVNFGSKAFRRAFSASQAKPSIGTLRATKQAAYKAVDDAGEVFNPQEVDGLIQRVKSVLDDGNYVAGVDKQTDAVMTLLDRKAGQNLTLGQLDKIRQSFWKRYSSAPNETGILDAIDEIDNLIANRESTNELMVAARLANSRFKKAELLDNAFRKAADQTASTGSGGNILNKYRQAVTSIINNPKQAKWFSPEEIDAMRNFVRGDIAENVLRRIGKLAPGGNGLMLALNLGAVAANPAALTVTAGASASKAAADAMTASKAQDLMRMVAGQRGIAARPPAPASAIPSGVSSIINQ